MRTSRNGKNIYSIDMMITYINIFKPKAVYVDVNKLLPNLEYKGWGDPTTNIKFSAMDVLNKPNTKRHKEDYNRINDANLKYPIILDAKNNIFDGIHRLAKAHLSKKKIKACIFTQQKMSNFILDKNGNYNKVFKLQSYDLIELFYKKFCNL